MTGPTTYEQLRSDLEAMGFATVGEETLNRCVSGLGPDFAKHARRAALLVNNPTALKPLQDSYRRALNCASPTVTQALHALRIEASLVDVIEVARRTPSFIRLAKMYAQGDAPSGDALSQAFRPAAANDPAPPTSPAPVESKADLPSAPAPAPQASAPKPTPQQAPAPERPPKPVSPAPSHAPPDTSKDQPPVVRDGIHVYGGAAALFFEPSLHHRTQKRVLIVDGAKSLSPRNYDWANKVVIQLTANEMLLLYAVLVGCLDQIKIDAHGEANDKRMEVKDQGDKFFASLTQKGRPAIGVPITPMDAAQLALMLSRHIIAADPQLRDIGGLNVFVESFVGRLPRRAA